MGEKATPLRDVLYIVKPSDVNEELRYSLRSLQNIPHGKVFIAGYKPSWVENVIYIPNFQSPKQIKYRNSGSNWRKANADERLSQEYILMNDDFFIMKPVEDILPFHQGSQDAFISRYLDIGSRAYVAGAISTKHIYKMLGRVTNKPMLNYELHLPMVFDKTKRAELSEMAKKYNPMGKPIHFRTLYGNFYNIGGEKIEDVKILGNGHKPHLMEESPFLSTQDDSFGKSEVGEFIRSQFPEPSHYERKSNYQHDIT